MRIGLIVLAMALGAVSAYVWMYKKQIKSLSEQLNFIRRNDTNRQLELSLRAKEFQDLAKQLNAVLTQSRDERAALHKAEQAFKKAITNVSHDLRTPLTSVVGYIEMLENKKTTRVEREAYYRIAKDRIRHLVQMLDDLFELARIESDEYALQLEKINVCQIFVETIYLFHRDFIGKHAGPQLQLPDVPLYIIGDAQALQRILGNVIRNALTHGEGDFKVQVEKSNGKVRMQFQNRATDLEEPEVGKLFERFYTADASRRRKTTGLGLSITKSLVEMMNGEIMAEKREDAFVLTILFNLPAE